MLTHFRQTLFHLRIDCYIFPGHLWCFSLNQAVDPLGQETGLTRAGSWTHGWLQDMSIWPVVCLAYAVTIRFKPRISLFLFFLASVWLQQNVAHTKTAVGMCKMLLGPDNLIKICLWDWCIFAQNLYVKGTFQHNNAMLLERELSLWS